MMFCGVVWCIERSQTRGTQHRLYKPCTDSSNLSDHSVVVCTRYTLEVTSVYSDCYYLFSSLSPSIRCTVTNSLAALSRGLVFCTEPFRIPFAGKLDVLCFDKTGTLTVDKMVLKGVVGCPAAACETEGCATLSSLLSATAPVSPVPTPSDIDEVPSSRTITAISDPTAATCAEISLCIMASCHSLLVTPETGAIAGDPLEIVTIESSGFQFIRCVCAPPFPYYRRPTHL